MLEGTGDFLLGGEAWVGASRGGGGADPTTVDPGFSLGF